MAQQITKAELARELDAARARITELEMLLAQMGPGGVYTPEQPLPGGRRLDDSQPFLSLFKHMERAYHSLDGEGRYLSLNYTAAGLLGYAPEELIGASFTRVLDPATRMDFMAYFSELMRAGQARADLRLLRKDGAALDVHLESRAEYSAAGEFLRSHCIFYSINERKKVERDLRASEQKFRWLIESIEDAVVTIDLQGRLLYVNPVAAGLLGRPAAELVGQPLFESHPVFIPPRQSAAFLERLRQGQTLEVERMMGLDRRWRRVRARPLKNARGEIEHVLVSVTDIHALKTTQMALEELNRTLEQRVHERTAEIADLYNHAPCGYHSLDSEGRVAHINDTELNWLGYTRAEVLGRPAADFLSGASRQTLQDRFTQLRQTGALAEVELEMRRKDGTTFPALLNAATRPDEHGGPPLTRATLFDISERKKAEQALHASNSRLDYLQSEINAIIFTTSLGEDFSITFISDSVQRIVGYPPEKYLEEPNFWMRQVHPADLSAMGVDMDKLLQTGADEWDCRVLCADGQYRWMTNRMRLRTDDHGRPLELIGVTIDIDEQVKAAEALRISQEQNRLLFEESPDSVFLVDRAGQIVRANRAVLALFQVDEAAVIGRRYDANALLAPREAERLNALFDAFFTGGEETATLDYEITRADGSQVQLEAQAYRLRINGDDHLLITNRDVTVRKKAADALRLANYELEQAMRMKDEFLTSMSHELRTPLTGIMGMAEALQYQVYGALNEKQGSALDAIQGAGRHLLDLINDILDVSKIEASKLELVVEPFSLGQVCQAALQLVKGMAQKKNQRVNFRMNPPEVEMLGDPRRVKQILANLLSNAVKYSLLGKSIGLEVDANAADELVRLAVWDEGRGIKPEDYGKLFKPFTQLDSGLARQENGTGLGLTLVRRLVDLHGGSVQVTSAPGVGSRFTVTLPWRRANFPAVPLAQTAPLSLEDAPGLPGDPLVLVVDDNEVNNAMLCDFLTGQGIRAGHAASAEECLAQAARLRPGVILMDIQMPGVDGLEATRRLRALPDPALAATPVIALTALAMPGDRQRCLDAGANEYLAKPVSLPKLLRAIRACAQPA